MSSSNRKKSLSKASETRATFRWTAGKGAMRPFEPMDSTSSSDNSETMAATTFFLVFLIAAEAALSASKLLSMVPQTANKTGTVTNSTAADRTNKTANTKGSQQWSHAQVAK